MMNETRGMIYTLNREAAEQQTQSLKTRLTPEQIKAHDSINELPLDVDGQLAALFCIMDKVREVDNCSYSLEAYRAIEAAAYDAYMMGKLSK